MFQRIRKYLRKLGFVPTLIKTSQGSAGLRIGGMFFGLLVGVQLARGLGVDGYEVYMLALSIVTFIWLQNPGSPLQWSHFDFVVGDIRSLADPITTNSANITGFLDVLVTTRDGQVNLLAATMFSCPLPLAGEGSPNPPPPPQSPLDQVYNVAVCDRTTLNDLFRLLSDNLAPSGVTQTHNPCTESSGRAMCATA